MKPNIEIKKPIYTTTILIPTKEMRGMEKILRRKSKHPDYKDGNVIETYTAPFLLPNNNKYEVDIKVCNAENPYVDPVLFEIDEKGIGQEVCVGEVSDSLEGEYIFDIKEGYFTVHVIKAPK